MVEKNNVDTSTPGQYQVTYKVTNGYGEFDQKTINVTVFVIDDMWKNGEINNWRLFAGEKIDILNKSDLAIKRNYVLYANKHSGLFKQIQLENKTAY
ncbi:hypothetical protein BTW32_26225 [Bacillus thuringiensis]|nr:hypothetical protein BTW32_26225 [Bacillus thuringiensis]